MSAITKYNKMASYAKQAIKAFNDVLPCGADLPIVMVMVGETDYCGKMITGVINSAVTSAVMVLCLDEIVNAAIIDNVSIEQMTLETIYHEWIHFIHSLSYPDDMGMRVTHEGELWESMITIGMDSGFIHREAI